MSERAIKFAPELVPMVLSGAKTTTWRINDEKRIQAGDTLSLIDSCTGHMFAKAQVEEVRECTFNTLDDWAKNGHERFASDLEMLATYARYYGIEVTPDTAVKVIRFAITHFFK